MWLFFLVLLALPAFLTFWPSLDTGVSALFYREGTGFFLANNPFFIALHDISVYGSRLLALVFLLFLIVTFIRKKNLFALDQKAWLFLLLALVVGPGLLANVGFKDHWGRARPNMIIEFGGTAHFTPALLPSDQCVKNCSFVAGDPSFGFFLPAFSFVAPRRNARSIFWGGFIAGCLLGFDRLAMGAHFLSDIGAAALIALFTNTLLYGLMYGRVKMRKNLKNVLSIK